ncbi:superoxide dismutase [Syncephalastrum racemosum]|uniref:Superoxide dismutase [Cu-Zn] n=1 Tax=Syncephalastrum racemosum TaxID=13706 RepID=A0A1X2HMV2_SYNRA|nr:superoxide dismutase [Syncephalastrum racemosum]
MVNAVAILSQSAAITGMINFTQPHPGAQTTVTAKIHGLEPGKHGIHVHSLGDISGGCNSTGTHWNPRNMTHGGPNDEIRHAGDFGNVVADANGDVCVKLHDDVATLFGPESILGRAIVIHALEDDLGRGGNAESKSTGNAGGRLACGIIGISSLEDLD